MTALNQEGAHLVVQYTQAMSRKEFKREELQKHSLAELKRLLDDTDTQGHYGGVFMIVEMTKGQILSALLTELGYDEIIEIYGDRLIKEYDLDLEALDAMIWPIWGER